MTRTILPYGAFTMDRLKLPMDRLKLRTLGASPTGQADIAVTFSSPAGAAHLSHWGTLDLSGHLGVGTLPKEGWFNAEHGLGGLSTRPPSSVSLGDRSQKQARGSRWKGDL